MANLIEIFPSIGDGINISMMTHDWVDTKGWSVENNALEHNIGMFIISSEHTPNKAFLIGTSNEVRDLIINDRQSGNMKEAISGSLANHGGSTAFEWSDLSHNSEGIKLFHMYKVDQNHDRKMTADEWMIFKLNIGGLGD